MSKPPVDPQSTAVETGSHAHYFQLPRKLPKRKSRFKRSDGSTSSDTTSSFIKRQRIEGEEEVVRNSHHNFTEPKHGAAAQPTWIWSTGPVSSRDNQALQGIVHGLRELPGERVQDSGPQASNL
ncbi:hypothetical protein EYF80_016597 [Liparis tanakae]|uniref:Uncharacterized protein n=1 Tax=Liparis tanakae TaxID=230148 RepID=A0A4Z2I5R5_9TELE|nr:hypothetical protein EYF80_016597 [Liparis tanakae]